MRLSFTLLVVALLATTFLLACGDDETPTGPDKPRPDSTFYVPFPTPLAEALDQAQPGDTLEVISALALGGVVSIPSSVTPLVIRGNLTKERAMVTGSGSSGFRFVDPRAGTRVEHLAFSGQIHPLKIEGTGAMAVEDCDFEGGTRHVYSEGGTLQVTVADCLMIDPGLFGIDAGGAGRVIATGNTIVGAGDCGIVLRNQVELTAVRNLITGSGNFGIACNGSSALVDSGCNDIFDSATAHYGGCTEPELDFHLDPQFCPADSAAWFLQETSPCAPLNSGMDCGNERIGARGVGCFPQF